MRRLLPLALSAVACCAAIGLLSPTAQAANDPISVNVGSGWVHDSTTPLFHEARIVPGWSTAKTLAVRNNTDASMTLGISSADIVDDENGCTHAEAAVDTTCGTGPDQGELSREMIFNVYLDPTNSGSYASKPAWTGTLRNLQQVAVLDPSVPAHAVYGMKITAALPWSSGNETQTDSVGFGLRLIADGTGGAGLATAVLGQTFIKGGDPTGAAGHPTSVLGEIVTASGLPFTGLYAHAAVASGMVLVFGGGVLWVGSLRLRRRQSSRSEPTV